SPLSSSDPFIWTIDARWSDSRSRLVRVPEAVQFPSKVRHSPAAGAFWSVAAGRPHAATSINRASADMLAPVARAVGEIHLNRSPRPTVTSPMGPAYGKLKRT